MRRLVLFAFLCANAAAADDVFLKGGGRVSGVVVDRSATRVVIDVGAGRVTLPMSRVERVVSAGSSLAAYRDRASRLAARDVEGWLSLAAWANGAELPSQAREAYERVLAVDPDNAAAHSGVGDVRVGERWMSREDGSRALGLVQFEGRWVTPAEQRAALAERVALEESRNAADEAAARAREAEARARTAEAEAAVAEAQAAQPPAPEGIPLYPPYGGYGGYGGVYGGGFVVRHRTPPPPPTPSVAVPAAPRPQRDAAPPPPRVRTAPGAVAAGSRGAH